MEILELNLKHFGRFEDYTLNLHAGINVISGGNETGKTTLHAFIRAMLYGITRTRSRVLDEYQLRQPWENPNYFAGSMRVLHGGKIYRIDRNFFHRDASVEIVNETDGTRVDDVQDALRVFTAGLSETDFDNTLFIRQTGAETSPQLAERLRNFLINVQQTGGVDTDVDAAHDYLKKRRKEVEAKKAAELSAIAEAISKNEQEASYVTHDLERLLAQQEESSLAGAAQPAFERVAAEDAENLRDDMEDQPDRVISSGLRTEEDDREPGSRREVPEEDDREPGSRREVPEEDDSVPVSRREMPEEDDRVPDWPEERSPEDTPGALFLPVLVLLCFAAVVLSAACVFFAQDMRLRIALIALCGIFAVMGAVALNRVIHPRTHAQKEEKRLRREAFLEKHLGFREDPEDEEAQERAREKELERRRRMLRAEEKDRQVELDREIQARRDRQRLEEGGLRNDSGYNSTGGQRSGSGNSLLNMTLREQEAAGAATKVISDTTPARAGDPARETERARARAELLTREIRTRRERLDELKKEQEELYDKKAGLGGYDQELRAIELADTRIRELSGSLYRQSGEEFLREASGLLSQLTEGRYTSLSLDESLQLWINTPDKLLKVTQVSYAAMNQVYLALRMAAADLLTGGAELPILMDEPFAMYDDERLETALAWLSSSGRQVILFTCQSRELDALAKLRA